MSQYCPVCKTRLWTDPLFTPARLCCPRCGAEFKPTVSWLYFRILLLIVVSLAVALLIILSGGNWWVLVVVLVLGLSFWLLPRLINLEHIGPALSEGVLDSDQMNLDFDEARLEEKFEEFQEKLRMRRLWAVSLGLIALAVIVLSLWRLSSVG